VTCTTTLDILVPPPPLPSPSLVNIQQKSRVKGILETHFFFCPIMTTICYESINCRLFHCSQKGLLVHTYNTYTVSISWGLGGYSLYNIEYFSRVHRSVHDGIHNDSLHNGVREMNGAALLPIVTVSTILPKATPMQIGFK
jgi:hypothetical protein